MPRSNRRVAAFRELVEVEAREHLRGRRMITDGETLEAGAVLEADVAIIGSGPAGITTALELENHGLKVLSIESGHRRFDSGTQALGDATIEDPARHAPMSMTTRRVLGGASSVWGGRCVPFDPVDFRERPFVDGDWPVSVGRTVTTLPPCVRAPILWAGRVRSGRDATSAAEYRARIGRRRRSDLDI